MRTVRLNLVAWPIALLALSAPVRAADGADPDARPSLADAELRREMAGWLSDIRENAGQARNFVLDQAPLVVRDLVAMGRAESTLWLLGWIASLVIAGCLLRRTIRLVRLNWEDADEPTMALCCLALVWLAAWVFASAVGIACCLHDFVTAWFAPRIFVIEYVADMLGTMHGGK